ncbi:type IA DNA topoisomerase [Mediterraneibacter gnavus]|jgi:DNA topoisomerase-3|uniref:DNA topoisomerase n=1 Tax=Mediterraneibacter gnavus TaxID=33038 RepID=A0A415S3D5_MEDGN|nr:type IA DNA topoisomerase [Mediterraneibacter gnavus]RHM69836.1 type IA DNA topoisomerase [Mediterraneibacter gnavus]
MNKLVIAEKPSVAQSIAKVLGVNNRGTGYLEGNGYIVSWCVGHLVELAPPEAYGEQYAKWRKDDLPIFPEPFQHQILASTKKQFDILKKLMERSDVESLICATDAGREGELIFRLVYHQCECRKPFERLWISSMEDSAILEGFQNLRPSKEYDTLYEAALCRERADWIVGINATRLFSCLYNTTLNVGRVMTPTLGMVVMREALIDAFVPEPFYTVQLITDRFSAVSGRFQDKAEAEKVLKACETEGRCTVVKAERQEKKEKPPALYDLTSLQREANRLYGFTAQQTLEYAQSLYEKKMMTYPRTDSRYLTEDMKSSIPKLVKDMAEKLEMKLPVTDIHAELVINSKKVTDHHALLPTETMERADLSALSAGELIVLKMVTGRLLTAVGAPYRFAETTAELKCADQIFAAKGKEVLEEGWRSVERELFPKEEKEETRLPQLEKGESYVLVRLELKEGKTSPPKHFTEDRLLQAMENASMEEFPEDVQRKGIGTPATRAAIIEKLVQKSFLERQGKGKVKILMPTEKGKALITIAPEQLQSPSMTADWEEQLLSIERGEYDSNTFLREIQDMISTLVQTYEKVEGSEVLMGDRAPAVGVCPVCGDSIEERKKGFFCSNRSCPFALWKNNRYFESIGKTLTAAMAQKFLSGEEVKLKGCKSAKTGRKFDASISMTVTEEGRPQFNMKFEGSVK